MKNKIRHFLWKILGISYDHIQKVVDQNYLAPSHLDRMGEHTYSNNAIIHRWSNNARITIGKYCSISYDVRFICDDGAHEYNHISNYPFKGNLISKDNGIIIGNDVWIGQGAKILPDVHIGDGATVAAGAVVNNDVLPYTVVGGIPAKVIKEKCTREEAIKMSEIAWWNWDDATIEERRSDFKLSFSDFISKYGTKETS